MRLLIVLLGIALLVLQVRLWVSAGGMREVWRLNDQMALRTEENRLLAERNDALEAEVQDLKKGLAAAEERARSELGMVLPSEVFYQIMPQPAVAGGAAAERYTREAGPSVDESSGERGSRSVVTVGLAADTESPEKQPAPGNP